MGWLFCAETKDELVKRLLRPEEDETCKVEVIAHSVVGSKLWLVREYTAKVQRDKWFNGRAAGPGDTFRLLSVCLLGRTDGHDTYNLWGYSELDEGMEPFHYSCPLKLLKLAPEVSPEWRKRVREWHAEKRKVPAWKSWKIGDVVEAYEQGKLYTIHSPRLSKGRVPRHVGWNVRRVSDGKLFRFDRYALREGVRVSSGGVP